MKRLFVLAAVLFAAPLLAQDRSEEVAGWTLHQPRYDTDPIVGGTVRPGWFAMERTTQHVFIRYEIGWGPARQVAVQRRNCRQGGDDSGLMVSDGFELRGSRAEHLRAARELIAFQDEGRDETCAIPPDSLANALVGFEAAAGRLEDMAIARPVAPTWAWETDRVSMPTGAIIGRLVARNDGRFAAAYIIPSAPGEPGELSVHPGQCESDDGTSSEPTRIDRGGPPGEANVRAEAALRSIIAQLVARCRLDEGAGASFSEGFREAVVRAETRIRREAASQ